MEVNEIVRRLEKIAPYGTHYPGEPLFVLSLDDGIALKEAIELLKKQKPQEVTEVPDRGTVIKGLESVSYYFMSLLAVGWQGDADIYKEHREKIRMAITLLKEQDKQIDDLKAELTKTEDNFSEYVEMMQEKQEPVEPKNGKCPECGYTVHRINYDGLYNGIRHE